MLVYRNDLLEYILYVRFSYIWLWNSEYRWQLQVTMVSVEELK